MPISVPVAENATVSAPAPHLRDIRTTTLSNGLLVITERNAPPSLHRHGCLGRLRLSR